MRFAGLSSDQWKRVCDLASQVLDAPAERDAFLARECGSDEHLRAAVLQVVGGYSDSEDLFGAQPLRPQSLADPRIGRRIGAWRVLSLLGEGGMGRVYLVERADEVFAKRAALKLIRGYQDTGAERRFRTERHILGGLDHPAIARALDEGTTPDGAPYLVMEYVDGLPIDRYCESLPVREKIRLFPQVLRTTVEHLCIQSGWHLSAPRIARAGIA